MEDFRQGEKSNRYQYITVDELSGQHKADLFCLPHCNNVEQFISEWSM